MARGMTYLEGYGYEPLSFDRAREILEAHDVMTNPLSAHAKHLLREFLGNLKPSNAAIEILLLARERKHFDWGQLTHLIETMDRKMYEHWTTACDLAAAADVC